MTFNKIRNIEGLLEKYPRAIEFIDNPSDDIIALAVSKGMVRGMDQSRLSDDLIKDALKNRAVLSDIKDPSEDIIRYALKNHPDRVCSFAYDNRQYFYNNKELLNDFAVSNYHNFDKLDELFLHISFENIYKIINKVCNRRSSFYIRNNKFFITSKRGFIYYKMPEKKFEASDFDIVVKNEVSYKRFLSKNIKLLLMFKELPKEVQKFIFPKIADDKEFHYLITDSILIKKLNCISIIK
jgi:hypothetical protein